MWMVVGFEVMPCSIKREKGDTVEQVRCSPWGDPSNPTPQKIHKGAEIIYTCAPPCACTLPGQSIQSRCDNVSGCTSRS